MLFINFIVFIFVVFDYNEIPRIFLEILSKLC
jgi:hypothetical protein